MSNYTLSDLRAHLVDCFEQDVRIVGNTTQREIVQAIDAAIAAADVLRQECRELTEQRDAAQRELSELSGHHQRVVEQRNKDSDALMVEIALAVGNEEEREGAECGEIEEFDPWHALRRHTADRDAARTEIRDVITAKQQLTDDLASVNAQLAGYRVLFEEQGRALTATRASVASLRERLDQYMPIDSVLSDWDWGGIVESGCAVVYEDALVSAAKALAHIERELAKVKEAKASNG